MIFLHSPYVRKYVYRLFLIEIADKLTANVTRSQVVYTYNHVRTDKRYVQFTYEDLVKLADAISPCVKEYLISCSSATYACGLSVRF